MSRLGFLGRLVYHNMLPKIDLRTQEACGWRLLVGWARLAVPAPIRRAPMQVVASHVNVSELAHG
jgi:hypothetical protein